VPAVAVGKLADVIARLVLLLDEPELDVPEPLLDEPVFDVPELLLDAGLVETVP
jgi:hypothetical protein